MLGSLTTKIFPFPTMVKTLGPSLFNKPFVVQNIIKMQFFQLFHSPMGTIPVFIGFRTLDASFSFGLDSVYLDPRC